MSIEETIEAIVRKVIREELPAMIARVADADRLLDVREVAGRLGLSVATVYELAEELKIPSVKLRKALRFRWATSTTTRRREGAGQSRWRGALEPGMRARFVACPTQMALLSAGDSPVEAAFGPSF